MNVKRILSALVTTALVGTALAGCGESPQNSGSSGSTASENKSGSSQTTGSKENKLTFAVQQNLNIEDYETNYFTTLLEKELEMEMDFLVLPSDGNDAKTKFSMMVSSGSTLPDVLVMGLDETTSYDYASKGVFLETTPYLTDSAAMPNFSKIPADVQEIMLSTAKLADGKVYSMPRYNPFEWNEGSYRFWVYQPWLDQVGAKIPTNTDEFYELCKTFAATDMNGNGKKDEIAVIGSKDGWGQNPMVYLMNAFTYANPDKNYFAVEDGKIVPSFTKDEWKQGLEYMNKLVTEGLLTPLAFTQDQTQMKAILASAEKGSVGFTPAGSYSVFSSSPVTHWKMSLMPPIAGPSGHKTVAQNPSGSTRVWQFTKDCRNVELAVKISDFCYEENNSYTIRFGEKDVDWSRDPAICEQYYGEVEETMGIKCQFAVINNIWNKPQNKMWLDMAPGYRSIESGLFTGTLKKGEAAETANPSFLAPFSESYAPFFPKEVIYTLPYTPEETGKIANAKTAIDTHVKDMSIAFITGNRPLEQWDSYLSELESMGLQDYVAATQTAYDRTK